MRAVIKDWVRKFQSALPCGERRRLMVNKTVLVTFQSALPCGERRGNHSLKLLLWSFNPRSRVGSDNLLAVIVLGCGVSIRAPVWGATTVLIVSHIATLVSIRAPVWGATRYANRSRT